MFKDLTFEANHRRASVLRGSIICNAGSIIVNTEEMKANGLPVPNPSKTTTDPVYKERFP